jgi:hypothetical protein
MRSRVGSRPTAASTVRVTRTVEMQPSRDSQLRRVKEGMNSSGTVATLAATAAKCRGVRPRMAARTNMQRSEKDARRCKVACHLPQ